MKSNQKYSKKIEESQKKHMKNTVRHLYRNKSRNSTAFVSDLFENNRSGHKAFCDELRETLTLKGKSRNSLRSGYNILSDS